MQQEHFAPPFDSRPGAAGSVRRYRVRSALLVLAALLMVAAACGESGGGPNSASLPEQTFQAADVSAALAPVTAPGGQDDGQSGTGANPCELLTAPEMEVLFGAPVESTEIPFESITTSTQCLWNKVSESVGGADELPDHYVLVQIPIDEYDLDQLRSMIERGGIVGLSSPVDGIGDGAVLVVGSEGISVVVGTSGFHLRIALDPDPTDEAIKALAVSAASRMAQRG